MAVSNCIKETQPTVELNDHFGTEGVQGVTLWLNAGYKQMILFEIFFLRGEFSFLSQVHELLLLLWHLLC